MKSGCSSPFPVQTKQAQHKRLHEMLYKHLECCFAPIYLCDCVNLSPSEQLTYLSAAAAHLWSRMSISVWEKERVIKLNLKDSLYGVPRYAMINIGLHNFDVPIINDVEFKMTRNCANCQVFLFLSDVWKLYLIAKAWLVFLLLQLSSLLPYLACQQQDNIRQLSQHLGKIWHVHYPYSL